MRLSVCVIAILTVVSTAAMATDGKQEKKATVPAVSATQMSDSEMDKVTAGFTWRNPGGHLVVINNHAMAACVHGAARFCP
jgi:hypothetical protein